MENTLTSILDQNVAHKTLVQFSKPWTLYSVADLRYRGSKMKTSQRQRFFEKKPRSRIFFEITFHRKCSLGSRATFSENLVSVTVLGFEKFASQV